MICVLLCMLYSNGEFTKSQEIKNTRKCIHTEMTQRRVCSASWKLSEKLGE